MRPRLHPTAGAPTGHRSAAAAVLDSPPRDQQLSGTPTVAALRRRAEGPAGSMRPGPEARHSSASGRTSSGWAAVEGCAGGLRGLRASPQRKCLRASELIPAGRWQQRPRLSARGGDSLRTATGRTPDGAPAVPQPARPDHRQGTGKLGAPRFRPARRSLGRPQGGSGGSCHGSLLRRQTVAGSATASYEAPADFRTNNMRWAGRQATAIGLGRNG